MLTYKNVITHSEENLRYIGEHKRAFDIDEQLYPLDVFEEFVREFQWGCGIYCCCNIEKDKLYAARFTLSFDKIVLDKEYALPSLHAALSFLRRVEARPEVKINYQLIQQFFGVDFDFRRIKWINVGVDARSDLSDTRLKIFITLENYPEKVATAIALCGEQRNWPALLVNQDLLIGFDFFLNGRSAVEVYPTFYSEDLARSDVQAHLRSTLPPRALPLLDKCTNLQIGISSANESDVLYFNNPLDPNDFVDNLDNYMAKKVHSYYRHQPLKYLLVGIPASDFYAWSIQSVKMYYRMTDFRHKESLAACVL